VARLASVALAALIVLAPAACKRSPPESSTAAPVEPASPARPPGASDVTGPELGPPSTALGPVPPAIAGQVALVRIARGLRRPVALEAAPGDARRLFVVEQGGTIRILRGGEVDPRPWLDLSRQVSRNHEERGLLGLAFHPGFADNRRLYVNYTDRKGDTRVVEYQVDPADPDRVDPATARELLALPQPWANHNGGGLEVGPDGALYVGTGDGGAADDPRGLAQDDGSRLGKMLRIDLDSGAVDVVAKGLRNPWRYAFDRPTGDLYIGDVGQNRWEWVHVIRFAELPGANFGWNIVEGDHCFRRPGCDRRGLVAPAVEYDHQTGCSITGGEVYRGKALPALDGVYFYVDYCTALIRSFRWRAGEVHQHWDWKPVLDPDFKLAQLSSFGVDHDGELYLLSLAGDVYQLVPREE
jgi:glucose/arabinose dehydrogenase